MDALLKAIKYFLPFQNAILGVFQKMIASKANDHEGFFLLQYLVQFYPM